jgi:hypothetical protein
VSDLLAEVEYAEMMCDASRREERAGHELEWLTLRRQIIAYGGIAANVDVKPEDIPGDLYRVGGHPSDLVAAEACAGAPWGDSGDDTAMLAYLWRSWRSYDASRRASVTHRAPKPVAPRTLKPGERSFADLVGELKRKHGAEVDLSGLRPEYVSAYETGERVTVERDGREYRGTIGATRGPRPRFVLLLSMDL